MRREFHNIKNEERVTLKQDFKENFNFNWSLQHPVQKVNGTVTGLAWSADEYFLSVSVVVPLSCTGIPDVFFTLQQGCQTYGPRAACGPRTDLMRPARKFFFMLCMRPANGFNVAREKIFCFCYC